MRVGTQNTRLSQMSRLLPFVIALQIFLCGSASSGTKLTIIVNKDVSADTISIDELRDIYLGHTQHWDDGQKIAPCYYSSKNTKKNSKSSANNASFLRDYLNVSPVKFRRHWLKRVFSGKGSAPILTKNATETVKYVADNSGAIGAVDGSQIDTTLSIKVITIQYPRNNK